MDDVNLTDLVQACHQAGFSNAHRGLGAEKLLSILEGRTAQPEQRPNSKLTEHRKRMEVILRRYGSQVRDQLGCDGDCAHCSDVRSAECAAQNSTKKETTV